MPRRAKRPEVYHPRSLSQDTIFFYLDSLATLDNGALLYPSYPLLLYMLPRMDLRSSHGRILLHSPAPIDRVFTISRGHALEHKSGQRYDIPSLVQRLVLLSDGKIDETLLEVGDTLFLSQS